MYQKNKLRKAFFTTLLILPCIALMGGYDCCGQTGWVGSAKWSCDSGECQQGYCSDGDGQAELQPNDGACGSSCTTLTIDEFDAEIASPYGQAERDAAEQEAREGCKAEVEDDCEEHFSCFNSDGSSGKMGSASETEVVRCWYDGPDSGISISGFTFGSEGPEMKCKCKTKCCVS